MERQNENIKVGRITRATERALDIALTGDVNIYMSDEELDALTERMPKTYLRFLREVAEILKNPDFVSFDASKEEFVYAKFYFKSDAFLPMYLFVGRGKAPGSWQYHRCMKGPKIALPKAAEGRTFVRPMPKKVEKESDPA